MTEVVDLREVAASLGEPWKPVDVVGLNEAVVRMARLEGEFPWHHHDQDELFLCWSGEFDVELRDRGTASLRPGQLVVVPRGVEHRPVARETAFAVMLERPETRQYED
jgi:quercetin dioxygenase-like cupin family protein